MAHEIEPAAEISGPNILLVDDRPENILAYEAILGNLDANLLKARSGQDALRCLLLHEVAVILLDVQMPDMDGFETATLIRQNKRFEHTPILFVTAGDKTEAKQAEGYAAGAVDFLFKPIMPGILRSKVRVFLELHRKTELLRRQAREEKAMAQQLAAQAQELERSNEDLERYAYIISHDLQQPLRVVGSFLQLLSRRCEGRLDPDAERYIGFATEGAARMSEMLSGLLAHSRVGRGGEIRWEQVDCDELLRQVRDNLRVLLEETEAVLEVEPLPELEGNPTLLAQLFQNLIQNAVKFRGQAAPQVAISAERDGALWRFRVRDNGIGFETRFADRIFEIFQRLHTREEYEGTGMGLAIARKIVQTHGGRLWARSEPGQGAEFLFTIPISQAGREPGA